MRALVQRVTSASVTAREDHEQEAELTGRIGPGLVALVGVTHDDTSAQAEKLATKLRTLRIFPDADGAMNRSCEDVGGAILVVSQFTLYGDARKGRRPSFVAAARPDVAEPLVDEVVAHLRAAGTEVATGRFRTHMQVELTNDGPVTLLLEV
jgi:D-tyrosyl-tRNA(Tyr) deacylase